MLADAILAAIFLRLDSEHLIIAVHVGLHMHIIKSCINILYLIKLLIW